MTKALANLGWSLVVVMLGYVVLSSPLHAENLIRLGQTIRPVSYQLALDIDPRMPGFSGIATIELNIAERTDRVVLHANRLVLDAITITQGSVARSLVAEELASDGTVALVSNTVLASGRATLTIRYHAEFASGLEGLYRVEDDGRFYAFTQFEAIGARRAFPCFDEPGFKATFTIDLTIPTGLKAITGTREIGVDPPIGGRTTHHFAPSRPLPSYLVVVAVGDFDIVDAPAIPPTALRAAPIPLRGIAAKGKGSELQFALDATAPLLTRTEDWFGIAYPFDKLDIIAVPDFGAGGMENAGAVTYEESLALLDEDATLQRQREFVTTHAHELAHQWFGNFTTPRWWDDLWLNESVASFMESKIAAQWKPSWRFENDRQLASIEAMGLDLLPSVRRVHEPVTTAGGISAAFDPITYQKGAAVLGMAENAMGAESFRDFMHNYLAHRAFGVMDGADFLRSMAASPGGADAARLLQSYIDQPGMPRIDITRDCTGNRSEIKLRQQRLRPLSVPAAAPGSPATWVTRICLDALRATNPASSCVLLDQPQVQATSSASLCQDALLAGKRSPGYFALNVSKAERRALFASLPTLGRIEALAAAQDLDISLVAGDLTLAEYLDGVQALARHPDIGVRSFPFERLKALIGNTMDDERRRTLKSFVHALYRPQLDAIGLLQPLSGSKPGTWAQQLYREQLVELFVDTQSAPDLEVRLAELGQRIAADSETEPDDTALAPPDVVSAALVSAARRGGSPFLAHAVMRLNDADIGHDRAQWLGAIAASHAPDSNATIERLVSAPSARGQDVLALLFERANEPPYRTATWDFVQRSAPALLKRLDGDLDLAVVQVADGFCTDAQAETVDKAMRPLRDRIRGGAIQLAQTLDRIRACAALAAKLNQEPLPDILATTTTRLTP